MKVLVCIPPYVPSYFNAGHHLQIYQIAEYLKRKKNVDTVDCIDCVALRYSWRDICRLLIKKYDVVVLFNDFDGVDTFERMVYYIRKISPRSKIMTLGRVSAYNTAIFEKLGIDAIGLRGDYEQIVEQYCEFVAGNKEAKGFIYRDVDKYITMPPVEYLDPSEWGLQDADKIPYMAIEQFYRNDFDRFCGVPQKKELVVQIARGCPYSCEFCDVKNIQGNKERRMPIDILWKYLNDSYEKNQFDYVSFYAPVFTLDKKWVKKFCSLNIDSGRMFKWKCVTTINNLNDELIELMGKSGCFRIGVGIESVIETSKNKLVQVKKTDKPRIEELAKKCAENGIELNCFIMLGLDGESIEDVKNMFEYLKSLDNVRVRPTIYTPYQHMVNESSVNEIGKYNRQLFIDKSDIDYEEQIYEILYDDKNFNITKVAL